MENILKNVKVRSPKFNGNSAQQYLTVRTLKSSSKKD